MGCKELPNDEMKSIAKEGSGKIGSLPLDITCEMPKRYHLNGEIK
jgi:hypothetical protein